MIAASWRRCGDCDAFEMWLLSDQKLWVDSLLMCFALFSLLIAFCQHVLREATCFLAMIWNRSLQCLPSKLGRPLSARPPLFCRRELIETCSGELTNPWCPGGCAAQLIKFTGPFTWQRLEIAAFSAQIRLKWLLSHKRMVAVMEMHRCWRPLSELIWVIKAVIEDVEVWWSMLIPRGGETFTKNFWWPGWVFDQPTISTVLVKGGTRLAQCAAFEWGADSATDLQKQGYYPVVN